MVRPTAIGIQWSLFLLVVSAAVCMAQRPTCAIEWGPIIQISADSVPSNKPQLSVQGDTIHLLWYGFDTLGTASQDGIQYSHSFDGGRTFSSPRTLLPAERALFPGVIVSVDTVVYVACAAVIDTFLGTVLFRSTDAGTTWGPVQYLRRRVWPISLIAQGTFLHLQYLNPSTGRHSSFRSSDLGGSWVDRLDNIPQFEMIVAGSDRLHAIGYFPGDFGREIAYYVSLDRGVTWSYPEVLSRDDPFPASAPAITVGSRASVYAAWFERGAIVMRRSANGGFSWGSERTIAQSPSVLFPILAADQEFVTVAWDQDIGSAGGIGLRQSNDFGLEFCQPDSPSEGKISGEPAMIISGSSLHIAWWEEIDGATEIYYRRGELTENPELIFRPPKDYRLLQNYPNPFNGRTRIPYDVPLPSHVRIELLNVLGQRIAILTDEFHVIGRHEVGFEGVSVPTGVYFYRIVSGSFTATKQLLILR